MNKEIYSIIKKYNLHPKSYLKKKSIYIINDNKESLAIKLNTSNYDIYKYLSSHDFIYFPKFYNDVDDNYDILEYFPDLSVNKEQKINDYIKILAFLHQKTSVLREIDLDTIKEKYESLTKEIVNLRNYYHNLNNIIDKEMFLSPSMYLLVRNISLIYKILDKIEILLNELYEKNKDIKSIRVSLLHNNVDLDHLINNNRLYLISWDHAYFNNVVYELNNFYRKYYQYLEINDYIKIYESINKLTMEERKYLLILLSIPKKLNLGKDTYLDTIVINDEINYLNKVYKLLEEEDSNTNILVNPT